MSYHKAETSESAKNEEKAALIRVWSSGHSHSAVTFYNTFFNPKHLRGQDRHLWITMQYHVEFLLVFTSYYYTDAVHARISMHVGIYTIKEKCSEWIATFLCRNCWPTSLKILMVVITIARIDMDDVILAFDVTSSHQHQTQQLQCLAILFGFLFFTHCMCSDQGYWLATQINNITWSLLAMTGHPPQTTSIKLHDYASIMYIAYQLLQVLHQ